MIEFQANYAPSAEMLIPVVLADSLAQPGQPVASHFREQFAPGHDAAHEIICDLRARGAKHLRASAA